MRARALLPILVVSALLCAALWRLAERPPVAPVARVAPPPERRAAPRPPAIVLAPASVPEPPEPARESLASGPSAAASTSELWHARVVDAANGAPIADATLFLGRERARGRPRWLRSGADGRFPPLERGARGGEVARVRHADYVAAGVPLTPGHASRTTERVIRLARSAALDVRVVDGRGDARAGLDVTARLVSARGEPARARRRGARVWRGERGTWTGRTGPDGRCELRELPPDLEIALVLSVAVPAPPDGQRGDGAARAARFPEHLVLSPGELRVLDWIAPAGGDGCRVAGEVRAAGGEPVPGLELWLAAEADCGESFEAGERELVVAFSRSDPRGAFAFADVAPGRWRVGLAPGQPALARSATRVDVAVGETALALELRVERGEYVRGLVVGPYGRPIVGCALVATHVDEGFQARASSRRGGEFELGPLFRGEYRVAASARGVVVRRAAAPPEVLVRAGDEDVVIRLAAGGAIEGTARLAGSGAAAGATVWLCEDALSERNPRASAGADGRFRLDHLTPGRYALGAWTEDGAFALVDDVEVGTSETTSVELVLSRGARLQPVSRGGGSALLVAWSGRACARSERVGAPRALTVPAGTLRCEIWGGAGESLALLRSFALDLAPGETRRIELAR